VKAVVGCANEHDNAPFVPRGRTTLFARSYRPHCRPVAKNRNDFGFQVTSAAPIQAVEAKFDPSKIGVSGGGLVSMSETLFLSMPNSLFDNFPGPPVGHLSISSRELMQSTMVAPPRNTMFVRKDLVVSGGLNGTAFVEDVWQNFVPEPSTFALCGLGAIGILIRRRPNG